jgi:NMD protein affecting ribosome stability and mRNA decay
MNSKFATKPSLENKLCNKCKEIKPLTEFYKRSDNNAYRSDCKQCIKTKSSERWFNNPEFREKGKLRGRRWQRQNFYGLSLDDEILLREHQNNACAICKTVFKTEGDYHVDHCHITKKIRGLLCPHCNKGLGLFKDNPTALKQAADYVQSQGIQVPNKTKT